MSRLDSSSRLLTRTAQALIMATALTGLGAQAAPVAVQDLDLFVDPPTGFVFVKMPSSWKFVGKLDAQALRALPAGVHTSLLAPETDGTMARIAQSEPSVDTAAPRVQR